MDRPDRRLIIWMSFIIMLLVYMPRPAVADEASPVQISEVNRVGDRIVLEVYTPGGPVLTGSQFSISMNDLHADGVIATPGLASESDAGVVLVLDASGSMEGAPIANAKKAVKRFVANLDIGDEIAMVKFSTTAEVLTPFTQDRSRVLESLTRLAAQGETAAYDGVMRAVELVESRPPLQRNIILLTDGADTASDASLSDAIAAARHAGASVFIVAVRSPEYAPETIEALATKTGGQLVQTDNVSELSTLFEELARTLVSHYRIEFVDPDPLASTGEIEIEIGAAQEPLVGRLTVSLPVTGLPSNEDPSPGFWPSLDFPVQAFLIGIFAGVGTVAFILTVGFRARKSSPADRIAWYLSGGPAEIDNDALLNAALLKRAQDVATQLAGRAGYLERIEREIDIAGMRWRPGEVIVASLLLGLVASFCGVITLGPLAAVIFGVFGAAGPAAVIKHKASSRRKAFYAQLSDVLMVLTGALRAGYSLQQSVAAVAKDARPPASEEFQRVMAEVRLGSSLTDALNALAERVSILDFHWMVLAIEIQREVGGDLAETLESVAETIRERERLRAKIKTLTAEGRLSGVVLGALPFLMAFFIMMKSPDYLLPLFQDTRGLVMIGVSAAMMVVGFFWMRKIVRIEV